MREGGKKTFKKKNIDPIFGKGYEGDQIKKTLTFLKKVNEGDGKTSKKTIAGKIVSSLEMNLVFFGMFLLSHEIDCFLVMRRLNLISVLI